MRHDCDQSWNSFNSISSSKAWSELSDDLDEEELELCADSDGVSSSLLHRQCCMMV